MLFATGLYGFESGDVLRHRNDLRAGLVPTQYTLPTIM